MIYGSSSNTIKEYRTAGGAFMFFRKMLATVMTAGLMLSFVPSTALAATTGWQGDSASGWRYYTSESEYIESDWKSVGGKWYYFDASGYMVTGWVKVGSQWYYMDKNGAMKTGWLKDGNAWYYLKSNGAALQNAWEFIGGKLYHFNSSGAMETNKWIDCGESRWSTDAKNYTAKEGGSKSYNETVAKILSEYKDSRNWRYVGADGAAYTGWKKVGGQWYYFRRDNDGTSLNAETPADYFGVMCYGWLYEDFDPEKYYCMSAYNFDANGKYRTNCWYQGTLFGMPRWYYFGSDGKAYMGWKKINNKWYYFSEMDKYMWTGLITFSKGEKDKDGYQDYDAYYFKESGEMATSGWVGGDSLSGYNTWYYARSDGRLYANEWFRAGGVWYFAGGENGILMNVTDYLIGDRFYDFDENGACLNPYDGKTVTGWYKDSYHKSGRYDEKGGNWYYFDADGNKICDVSDYIIDGKGYNFDTHGICKNYRNPCIHDNELDIDN